MNTDQKLEDVKSRLQNSDVIFVSFPKSGRTWVRYFLAKYIEYKFNLPFDVEFNYVRDLIKIRFCHNYFQIYQDIEGTPNILFPEILVQKKVITIVRDPRDVIVSYYHQKKLREEKEVQDINEFIKSPIYGIERHSDFVLKLLDFMETQKKDGLLLSYERLKEEPSAVFDKLIKFIFSESDPAILQKAIEESTFDKMREYEIKISQSNSGNFMRFGTKNWDGNINSLKVRKGKTGSYKDELSDEAINYIETSMKTNALIKRLKDMKLLV